MSIPINLWKTPGKKLFFKTRLGMTLIGAGVITALIPIGIMTYKWWKSYTMENKNKETIKHV